MRYGIVAASLALVWAFAGILRSQEALPEIYGRVLSAESGRPVVGAQVAGPGGLTKADSDGRFSIPGKEGEDPMLLARAEGYALFHRLLTPTSHESEIVVELMPPKVAVVRVVGEDGKPVRGAVVRGRLPFAPAYSPLERVDFNATTDQDGVAVIKDIPSDLPLVAEVNVPGMVLAQSPTLLPVRPPAGTEAPTPGETITVTPGRSCKIVVEDEAGKPVAGAAISVLPLIEPRLDFGGHAGRDMTKGSIRNGVTDQAGAIAFDFLPAGPVACEIRAQGLLTQLVVIEGAKGKVIPVRVRLRPDPKPPGADVPWRASLAAATEESKRAGLPVFLVMTMDGEKANDWMAGHHYHDPEIVRAAREVIPILSSAFGEGGVGAHPDHREVDGKCARYGTIPCRVHQQIEIVAREALMQTRFSFEVPRHIAVTPSGDSIFHRVFYLSERDLLRLIVRALRITSRENAARLARERLATVIQDLASSDAAARKRGVAALRDLANSGDEHAAAIVQGLPDLGLPAATRLELASGLHPAALTAPDATLAALMRDPDRDVRRMTLIRMSELAEDDAVFDLLASELRASDGPTREALLRALDAERKSDEIRVRAPAMGNRWRLIEEIVDLPELGKVQGFEEALGDVGAAGRHRILRALGRRAATDAASQDLLIRALKGSSPVAALRALARALGAAKPPAAVVKVVTESAQAPDPLLREEALRILTSSSLPVDPEILATSLTHPWPQIRIQAALALKRRGDRRGEPVLLAAAHDLELGAEVRAALAQ